MKVFVAGGSGAIGRPLIQHLMRDKHNVIGMLRPGEDDNELRQLGAGSAFVDAFDRDAVRAALAKTRPDVVIDQLTSLPKSPADLGRAVAADSRLRLEGSSNLLAAAEALGVELFIQQSSGFYLAAGDNELADEEAALRLDAPGIIGLSSAMYAELERRTLNLSRLSGIVLRYGFFYGPGTWYWTDGAFADQVIRREAPVVGGGTGVWSFVHVEDAAAATVAALYTDPGIYNVVDDNPERVETWLPAFARWIGAPEPAQVSADDGLAKAGCEGVYAHTRLTGASNSKAKAALAFDPRPLVWMVHRET